MSGSTTLDCSRHRALIVAHSFRHYGEHIRRAFTNMGWDAILYEQQKHLTAFGAIRALSSSKFFDESFNRAMSTDTKIIVRVVTELNPNLVLIMNGDMINKKNLRSLTKMGTKLALWCYDSVSTHPRILDDVSVFDHVFTFEPTDLPVLSNQGVESSILQMAYDPTTYSPSPDTPKMFDLTFVGTLFAYPTRLRFLKDVVSMNPGVRIGIFTNTPPMFSPKRGLRLLSPFSSFYRALEMRSKTHAQVNEIYNSSRICLNTHHEQSKEGLNPRVFEILGSGAFQLVDQQRQLSDTFDVGKDIVSYGSEKDLQQKIRYFLENPRERNEIAYRGERKARSLHTYESRVRQLINTLEL